MELRWLRTARRSRSETRACPGSRVSTLAPIDPVYGTANPRLRAKSHLPPGSGASLRQSLSSRFATTSGMIWWSRRLDHNRRTIAEHFGDTPHDLGGVVPHADHR